MRRRAAARRNVHVNEAVATVGVVTGEQNGIGVPDDAEMAKALVVIWFRNHQIAKEIVRWDWRDGLCCDGVVVHSVDFSSRYVRGL
jgi:hypothetical protein